MAAGDDLYIAFANGINVNNSVFDHGYRNGMSITDLVSNATFTSDSFTAAKGTAPEDGVDIEPNCPYFNSTPPSGCPPSSSFIQGGVTGITFINSSFSGNNGDGVQFSLQMLTSQSLPVSVTIQGGQSSFNGIYGYGANNSTNPGGTIEIDNSSSSNDGYQCAAGKFWQGGGEELIFKNLACTDPHQNPDQGASEYYGSPSAVSSIRGGGGTQPMGNIHFCGTTITITPGNSSATNNTAYSFEYQDYSVNGSGQIIGFNTDIDFYPAVDDLSGQLDGRSYSQITTGGVCTK